MVSGFDIQRRLVKEAELCQAAALDIRYPGKEPKKMESCGYDYKSYYTTDQKTMLHFIRNKDNVQEKILAIAFGGNSKDDAASPEKKI